MRVHLSSFMLGVGVGGTAVLLSKRLRPVALELATAFYRIVDAVGGRAAMTREDLQDLIADAKARARGLSAPRPHHG
jgi:hypothetical protein